MLRTLFIGNAIDLGVILPPTPTLPLTPSKSEGEPLILEGELLTQALAGDNCAIGNFINHLAPLVAAQRQQWQTQVAVTPRRG